MGRLYRLLKRIKRTRRPIWLTSRRTHLHTLFWILQSSPLMKSTYVNQKGNIYDILSIESNINGKQKFSGRSTSILTLQKQLEDAQRIIGEQTALNAKQKHKI